MNRTDPLDDLSSGDAVSAEIPPAPEDYESEYPLVSERSKRDTQEFGLNMVDDYQDFEHE
ncbi:site-specific integrase, partial [Halobacteriales archaeon QH_8_68_33]